MKNLYVVRHAKAKQADRLMNDFERPLNLKGLRSAVYMAGWLKKQNVAVDCILTSPAKRAITTYDIFSTALVCKQENIHIEKKIYAASENILMQMLCQLNDKHESVMIFGHNPSLSLLSNSLLGKEEISIPTCGIVIIQLDICSWLDITPKCGMLREFNYP